MYRLVDRFNRRYVVADRDGDDGNRGDAPPHYVRHSTSNLTPVRGKGHRPTVSKCLRSHMSAGLTRGKHLRRRGQLQIESSADMGSRRGGTRAGPGASLAVMTSTLVILTALAVMAQRQRVVTESGSRDKYSTGSVVSRELASTRLIRGERVDLKLSAKLAGVTGMPYICTTIDWWPKTKCDWGLCSWERASVRVDITRLPRMRRMLQVTNLNLDPGSDDRKVLAVALSKLSPIALRVGARSLACAFLQAAGTA